MRKVRSVGKNSKPFLRGKAGKYYCWIDGRLRSLRTAKEKLAQRRYRELLSSPQKAREGKPWTVRQCLDYYLAYSKAEHKPDTHDHRLHTFRRFCEETKVGPLPWRKLNADHVEAWAKAHPAWSVSMKRAVKS